MAIYRPPRIPGSEITDKGIWENRRKFLKRAIGLGLVAGGAGVLARGSRGLMPEERKIHKIAGVKSTDYGQGLEPTAYEHITTYNNFYEFGTSKQVAESAADFKTRPWTVEVSAACEKPGILDIERILSSYTQEERIYRLRCVEAWSMVVPWVGVPLADLLKPFAPTSRAKFVAFETLYDDKQMPGQKRAVMEWPYREGLRIDEAMHPLTLMATGLYGEILPNQNGAPLRLVVPWKYGFKSIKSIVKIHFMERQPLATWNMMQPSEYGFYSNVNPQVSHPRWSQRRHRVIGAGLFAEKEETRMFNGYGDEVASLYSGMDLRKYF